MMVLLELKEAEVLACLCNESTVTDNRDIMLIWLQRFLFLIRWKDNINNFLSDQKQYKTKKCVVPVTYRRILFSFCLFVCFLLCGLILKIVVWFISFVFVL